ncbi:unnamed protein product, partial [Mesorhabditis belari]|uniref:EGF-like domain-containing protein n=1 Tax=Mesorhabditis belari TaxID=2138241 RepID=A0AAF3FC34_9BILA
MSIFNVSLTFLIFHCAFAELRSQLSKNQVSLIQQLLHEFGGIKLSFESLSQQFPENEIFFSLLNPEESVPLIELGRRENLISLSIAEENLSKIWETELKGFVQLYFRQDETGNLVVETDNDGQRSDCVSNEISKRIKDGQFKVLIHPNVSVNVTMSMTNSFKTQKSCEKADEVFVNETKSVGDNGKAKHLEHYCEYSGLFYASGSTFQPGACERCRCSDGAIACTFESPVPCDDSTPEWLRGCCPKVHQTDFCSPSPCGSDANCTNLIDRADCVCQEGFTGDGITCADVDECQFDEAAREQLGGCLVGTICVNTPGSFRCDCLPGHQRIDDRNCLDVLRI